jgi:putative hydrolase of the HAD superfamily
MSVEVSLVTNVDVLSLDAGNTIIFLDHARLADLATRAGVAADARAIERAEGMAKRAQEDGALLDFSWRGDDAPGARGWGRTLGTTLTFAGAPRADVPRILEGIWREHVVHNLYSLVPAGLVTALDRLRARGVHVAVVSNSEGMLEPLFEKLGVRGALDAVIDSAIVGVEKPDPRIFHLALDRFGVPAERALHLGDNFMTDIQGGRAAGMRVALVDPFDHLAGRHGDVPRVPGVVEVADAIRAAK